MYLYFTHPSRSQTDVKVGWVTSTFDTKGSFIFFQFTMKFGNEDTSLFYIKDITEDLHNIEGKVENNRSVFVTKFHCKLKKMKLPFVSNVDITQPILTSVCDLEGWVKYKYISEKLIT